MTRPQLFWLAVGLAVPIALHLWTRTRPKILDWAAWRFLPQPDPADERVISIDHPWLMLLRLLALAALIAGAIGPTCTRPAQSATDLSGIRHPMIVVDVSASMMMGETGNRPIDRAANLLDDWWRSNAWARGGVYVCHNDKRIELFNAEQKLPRRFIAPLEQQLRLGGADLAACINSIGEADSDIIVLSDRSPQVTDWQRFASARWQGVGRPDAPANAGIADVHLDYRGNTVRIRGRVEGPPRERVDLIWNHPARPQAGSPVRDGKFDFELLLPREDGRVLLRLSGSDAAPWDDRMPLWIPAGGRPSVHPVGHFSPREEHLLLDLLYAASDRLNIDFERGPVKSGPGKRIYILANPNELAAVDSSTAYADVSGGSIAIAFPGVSSRENRQALNWIPGWIHPPQPTKDQTLLATSNLRLRWPELDTLDWSVGAIRRIFPLADPDPTTVILLETGKGLPVLVRHAVGSGLVYNWLVDLDAATSNLPRTPVWVPLWLAMMDSLVEQATGAKQIQAGTAEQQPGSLSRIDTAYRADGAVGSLNWLKATTERDTMLLAEYVPVAEIEPGRFAEIVVFKDASRSEDRAAPQQEPVDTWWLLVAGALWLLHSGVSHALAAIVLIVSLTLGTPTPVQAQQHNQPIRVWLPSESGAHDAHQAGIARAVEIWRSRASPDVEPKPQPFSWSSTEPADPWVWWAGCKRMQPQATPALATNLRNFLRGGGTLWLDFCGGPSEFRRYAEQLGDWFASIGYGDGWRPLPDDHVIHRTFYLLDNWQDVEGGDQIYGLRIDRSEQVFLFPNMARALAADSFGNWTLPLNARAREWQIRQGLNLLMYTTTYDYKNDNIHLPYILERRKRHR